MNVYSSLIVTISTLSKVCTLKKNYYKNKLFNYKNLTNLFASGDVFLQVEKLLKYKVITPKTKAIWSLYSGVLMLTQMMILIFKNYT